VASFSDGERTHPALSTAPASSSIALDSSAGAGLRAALGGHQGRRVTHRLEASVCWQLPIKVDWEAGSR